MSATIETESAMLFILKDLKKLFRIFTAQREAYLRISMIDKQLITFFASGQSCCFSYSYILILDS